LKNTDAMPPPPAQIEVYNVALPPKKFPFSGPRSEKGGHLWSRLLTVSYTKKIMYFKCTFSKTKVVTKF